MKQNLTGKLHIGRVTSNSGDDYIRIELDDEKSGTIVTRIEIGLAEFTKALTSSCMNCKFDLFGTKVGLTREVKTEVIYIPAKSYMKRIELELIIKKAVEPIEIDGWEVNYLADGHNNHNITKYTDDGYYVKMGFIRFVDK